MSDINFTQNWIIREDSNGDLHVIDKRDGSIQGKFTDQGFETVSSHIGTLSVSGAEYPAVGTDVDITQAISDASGVVHLPPGEFTINSSVEPPDNVTLIGSGNATVLKLADGAEWNVFERTTTSVGITIKDLTIDLNSSNTSLFGDPTALHAIWFENTVDSYFENLTIKNGILDAIVLDGHNGNAGYGHGDWIVNCGFENFSGSQDPSAVSLRGSKEYCRLIGNQTWHCDVGFSVQNGNHQITANTISFSQKYGIVVDGVAGTGNPGKTNLIANTINHVTLGNAVLVNEARLTSVLGNHMYSIAQDGVILRGGYRGQVKFNSIGAISASEDQAYVAILLEDADTQNATKNAIHSNNAQIYVDSSGNNALYGVNESGSVGGNSIRLNTTVAAQGYSLNSGQTGPNDTL